MLIGFVVQGNCKFGLKCALAHITPDGRRVPSGNYKGGPLSYARVGYFPPHDPHQTSLLSMQQAHLAQPQMHPLYGQAIPDEVLFSQALASPGRNGYDGTPIPTVDGPFATGSNYGSPPNDRTPLSPVPVQAQKGLSVMDAPLPASFDSNGISEMARYGPIAASLPGRFRDSSPPPASIPIAGNANKGSAAVASLHNSAFGDERLVNMDQVLATSPPLSLGRSPPTNEELGGRRMLHSSRLRPKMIMSQSLDARPRMRMGYNDSDREDFEDDSNYPFEEELVPDNLSHLLTPQEKMRRFSRTADDGDGPFSSSHRQAISGAYTPSGEPNSKVGSPSQSSPSKFSSLFAERYANSAEQQRNVNPLSHVGSPLKSSPLNPGSSPSLRAISRPTSGDMGTLVSSPPRQGTVGMSLLSEHLRRTRLSARTSSDESQNGLHSGLSRTASSSSNPGAKSGLARNISSSSAGRSERIVESHEEELFQLDDVGSDKELKDKKRDLVSPVDENSIVQAPGSTKRPNGVWNFGIGRVNAVGDGK